MEYIKKYYEIPVIEEYDVVVCGAGPAGVSAAVSAARLGARTLIVERYGYPGGQATGGLVILIVGLTDFTSRIIKGFCEETIDALFSMNAAKNVGHHVLFQPETLKLYFDKVLLENSVNIKYHSYVTDAVFENRSLQAVILDGKSGKRAIKAKYFIDATADADLAKFCNLPYEQVSRTSLMPVTLGFRAGGIDVAQLNHFVRNNNDRYLELLSSLNIPTQIGGFIQTINTNEIWFNISTVENVDVTDVESLSAAEIKCRQQVFEILKLFKAEIYGMENAYIIDTAAQMGCRDSRRIVGQYKFTTDDTAMHFEDSIARAPNYTGKGSRSVEIPYRCLISPFADNIIFSGRSISVEHSLLNMFREIPCCMATGQAAGIATAVSLSENRNVGNINIKTLQKLLLLQNVIL